jgi:F0F1-type ATP synthase assembly protein I
LRGDGTSREHEQPEIAGVVGAIVFPEAPNPKEFGRYVAMGQVGLEMVAPIILGLVLDHYLGWAPWGLVGGAGLGLVGGLAHLIHLVGQEEEPPARNRNPTQDTEDTERS